MNEDTTKILTGTVKPLTGEMIFDAIQELIYRGTSLKRRSFADIRSMDVNIEHEEFEDMARWLNQQLGLCDGCGRRQDELFEVAGMQLCQECIKPPSEE